MQGKITLITEPDFFENSNASILFMHLNAKDQDAASVWLKNSSVTQDINFYVYSGEKNMEWLFYTMSLCEHKYINLDDCNFITQALAGHILSKRGVYYSTSNYELVEIYQHINHNRVSNIEQFLETILGDDTNKS
jgi:hypothetical protein